MKAIKNYTVFKFENMSKMDQKAYDFLDRLIAGVYEADESRKRIIIDKYGDCHQCDTKLATMENLEKYGWTAIYAIQINDNKIALHKLY